MIKKLKENFLILLISNLVTAALVVIAPTILGAITNLSHTYQTEKVFLFFADDILLFYMCYLCMHSFQYLQISGH